MYASLGLDLGVGSHAGQGTRHCPKSVLISDRRRAIDVSQNTWRATPHGVQHKATSFEPRINYFLKLTQPSSILATTAGRHERGHFNETDGQQVNGRKISASQRNRL
jgi:hypothetical protein